MGRLIRTLALAGALLATAAPAASAAAPPANDDFANAVDLGNATTASAEGDNLWATAEAGEPDHHRRFPAVASVWYRWTAPASGVVRVGTCESDFDTVLAVYRGPALGSLGRVAANDDACDERSEARFFAVAGTTYWVAVDGFGDSRGWVKLDLRVETPPPNDDFAAATVLPGTLMPSAGGTNIDATLEAREAHLTGALASVWYRWTAPARRSMQLETCGSAFDTILAVYVGADLASARQVTADDDSCGTASVAQFGARAGTTYAFAVAGFRGQQGSIRLRLQPSNDFRFVRLDRGAGELVVDVPNPGQLVLAGSGGLRRATARAGSAGRATLALRPDSATARRLAARGRASVRARVTFTPAGGRAHTEARSLRLRRG